MYRSIRNIARISATGVATSFVVTSLVGASFAAPTAEGYPGEPPLSRQCFMEQSHWHHVLDGPPPRCPGVTTDDTEPLQLRRLTSSGQRDGYGAMLFTY